MAEQERFLLSDLLAAHQRGLTNMEAGNALRELIAEVDRTGRTGTLTVKFSVTAESRDEAVKIAVDVTKALPKEPATPSLYFIDDHKRPSRRANQQPIPSTDGAEIFPPAEAKD